MPHDRDRLSYELALAEHRWAVPERFNIAADVCDRHPREKLAMIHEHFSGAVREVAWGELQDLSNQLANVLAALGVERGDRVAVVLPPTPETAAGVSAPSTSARRALTRTGTWTSCRAMR